MDGHSSVPLIARGLARLLAQTLCGTPAALSFENTSGTALHSIRILPFHFRFFVPMAELDLLARDRVPHAVSNMGVTARTSVLTNGGCWPLPFYPCRATRERATPQRECPDFPLSYDSDRLDCQPE